jgi:F-type H+-transporting ATPase subunit a
MTPGIVPHEIDIHPGVHPTGTLFGMTLNLDTIWVTVVAGLILIALGFWARSRLTKPEVDHVPSKLQLVWETVVGEVNTQVEANLGKVNPFVVPLAVALFFFILIANWIEVIPTQLNGDIRGHLLPSPTADTNLTYAMAIMVMVGVWSFGIRRQGLWGYLKHFYGQSIFPDKPVVDTPIRIVFTFLNILEELVKPVTLALRLFGNIFAGGIMLALIAAIPWWAGMPIANILWKLFDMAIGGLQAFIFALLTVLYFAMAGAGHGDEQHGEHGVEVDPSDQQREAREEREEQPVPAA